MSTTHRASHGGPVVVWAAGRRRLLAAVLGAVLCSALPGLARAWQFPATAAGWGRFGGGLAAGLAAHEAGHLAVLRSLGREHSWNRLSITYDGAAMGDRDHLRAASAGLSAGWVAAEAALGIGGEARSGAFGAGVVWAHLGTTAAYLTVLMHHPRGDLVGIAEATGLAPEAVALVAAGPALLDAWRLHDPAAPRWVRWAARAWKGFGLGWAWSF